MNADPTRLERVYLDNAATSWPKPNTVYDAVDNYQRNLGAPAGRSAYQHAIDAGQIIADARHKLAKLINAESPSSIVFTFNGTDSLNLATHGLLKPGDHVITSVAEHNSVLRPLKYLEESIGIEVTRVGCDTTGMIDPVDVEKAITPKTRLIAIIHASNVTGAIQPVETIGKIAADKEIVFLIDAAQSIGHVPVDVRQIGAHLLAAPGHKGLLGPLGTGFLYVSPSVADLVQSHRQGGTGTQSEQDSQPNDLPEKFESGNHNVAGLAGLAAGIDFVASNAKAIRTNEELLTSMARAGLEKIPGVTVYGPNERTVGVVSFTVEGYDPQEIASMLDSAYGIQVRSGFHCAPLIHHELCTFESGGTVRLSVGNFNTPKQITTTIQAIAEIAGSAEI